MSGQIIRYIRQFAFMARRPIIAGMQDLALRDKYDKEGGVQSYCKTAQKMDLTCS
jgi:hypothetical protein